MPETNPSDDIIELTDIVEEDGSPVAGPGSGDAGADMSFERELEDLFSDAGPAPASAQASAASPPPPAFDASLELEELDLPGMEPGGARASLADDDDDMDAIDLSDLVEDEPGDEALAPPPAASGAVPGAAGGGDDLFDAAVAAADAAADAVVDVADLGDLGDVDGAPAMDAELELPAPPASGPGDDDVLPDLTGLGLEEDAAFAAVATAAAATGAAPAAPPVAPPVGPDEGIDLEALDAIIAKAGGPPPVHSEAEAQAAAELLESAVARIAVLEDRISALETEVSGVAGMAGQAAHQEAAQKAALSALADALRTEFSALIQERLEAFGGEMAEKAPAPVDVTPALAALSTELKSFVEERLEAFDADMSARIQGLPDPAAKTAEAVAGLRDEISSLRDAVAALQNEHAAAAAAAAPGADDLDALRREAADLATTVEALRGDVACRVTKVDQDALVTRIRMDLAAEIQAGIEKAVPAEAARIIREEIAALAREMDD